MKGEGHEHCRDRHQTERKPSAQFASHTTASRVAMASAVYPLFPTIILRALQRLVLAFCFFRSVNLTEVSFSFNSLHSKMRSFEQQLQQQR